MTQNIANIATNSAAIQANAAEIASLGESVDILRSGVAATLAIAGMPVAPGDGWGYSIGAGSFDGESAVAAGLTYRSAKTTFTFSVGNSGGESTVSAGFAQSF